MIKPRTKYRTEEGITYETIRSTPYNTTRFWMVRLKNGDVRDWPEATMIFDTEVTDGN